jgi:hypothetical protein
MEGATQQTSWIEANQRHLVAEFARLKRLLDPKSDVDCQATDTTLKPPAAIDRLSAFFGLTSFERDVLLLCAGVEMDSKVATLCGEAQGHPQHTYLTFGLAMAALPEAHWSALAPIRPLRRYRLVELNRDVGLTSSPLRIDERILHYLAGVNLLDPRLEPVLQAGASPEATAENHQLVVDRIICVLEKEHERLPVFQLCGSDAHGQEDIAALVSYAGGRYLFVMRSEDIPCAASELEQFALLWERESVLLPGALLIQCGSEGPSPAVRRLAETLRGIVFLASREPARLNRSFIRFDIEKPAPAEQWRLWKTALGNKAFNLNGALEAVSEQFTLSAREIWSGCSGLNRGQNPVQPQDIWNACRSIARPSLEALAQRIIPFARWDDLVLPEVQIQTLRQIASHVRHRMKVYDTWGFATRDRRGLGVSALFTGESGTGKTMAAEVLANELHLDLYRVDLSAVVSKYIGETEKNLKQVFDGAEEGGVLLLFDEADALFGKRSDVKDSHDRYANIEVSYLLQRMESYQGLAILTTNLKASMDRAFQRRLRFTVNFPFPDAAQREAIWRRIFPDRTPTRGLDSRLLAQLNVTGGNIRNIALNAAFLAAQEGDGRPIEMEHLVQAAKLEAQKIERPLAAAEIRGWI